MKALFFPLSPGAGLAHAGACLSVASELVARGAESVIAYGGTRSDLIKGEGIRIVEVDEMPIEGFDDHNHLTAALPELADLPDRIDRDRQLIEAEKPDVVVIDMRFSAAPAAELAGVPTVTLNHFFSATGYSQLNSGRRRLGMLRHPLHVATRIESIFERDPFGARELTERLAAARRHLGLGPGEGLPIIGPCTAFTTTAELDPPSRPLPDGWHLVGPVTWSASGGTKPPPKSNRPLVFASQGTLGSPAAIGEISKKLAGLDADIAIVTMGAVSPELIEAPGSGITALEVVDNDAWLAAADVAVMHGGHLSMSAAARAGTPTVVIPDGRDHWAWAAKVGRLGTGIPIYRPISPGKIGRAVRKVLTEDSYRARAAELAQNLQGCSGEADTADLIEGVAITPDLGLGSRRD
ncbi:MAG: nucleotide disphospho-sugar-binding domain-containing protein [Solirubrobacterales bacterium]